MACATASTTTPARSLTQTPVKSFSAPATVSCLTLTLSGGRLAPVGTGDFYRPVDRLREPSANTLARRSVTAGNGAGGQERREKLAAETDDLLDEIDDVLETNAEDFVKSFIQKGGQ